MCLLSCDFVIWNKKGILVVEIPYNSGFMNTVLVKLEKFWISQILSLLLTEVCVNITVFAQNGIIFYLLVAYILYANVFLVCSLQKQNFKVCLYYYVLAKVQQNSFDKHTDNGYHQTSQPAKTAMLGMFYITKTTHYGIIIENFSTVYCACHAVLETKE